ncbi:MAG: hypothetical protein JRI92_13205 [Deltaproteobacteria bacterium]|nr:hypothetical protein [Deltaproteobacteria bacterium]
MLTSVRSPYELPHKALLPDASYLPILYALLFVSYLDIRQDTFMISPGLGNRSPLPVISPDCKMTHQRTACRTDLPG